MTECKLFCLILYSSSFLVILRTFSGEYNEIFNLKHQLCYSSALMVNIIQLLIDFELTTDKFFPKHSLKLDRNKSSQGLEMFLYFKAALLRAHICIYTPMI